MKIIVVAVSLVLASSSVFAEQIRPSAKHFSSWITEVKYDSTNDCYILRYNPTIKSSVRVYTKGPRYEPQKVQPGETYALARGIRANFTHLARVGCAVTFTNGVTELRGVALPGEIRDSQRQLLVDGIYSEHLDVIERYAFAVNAEGMAYDVMARERFHFGFPFHTPEDKTPPKLDRSMENSQRRFFEEGVNSYKMMLNEPDVRAMRDVVKEGVTNAVAVTVQTGGNDAVGEDVRKRLLESDPKFAQLFRLAEESKRQYVYVVFCTRENGDMRIAAVAKICQNKECHFWCYSSNNVPALVYLRNGRGNVENYCEYEDAGCFRNFCLYQEKRIASYWTIIDGVLQKSPDMQKAQTFITKVEEMFRRYVDLDTTGTLKEFVDKKELREGNEE